MIKINLNKKSKKIKVKIKMGGLPIYFIVPVVIAAAAIFFLQSSVESRISGVNKSIKIYNGRVAMLMPKVRAVNTIRKRESEIFQKINIIKALKKEQMGPIGYVYYITSAIPKFSWINSLKSTNGNMRISGIALDGQVVSIFMKNLENTGFFDNINLVQTSEVKKQGLKLQNFSLRLSVKGIKVLSGRTTINR
ncbi:PilN domain-containing protein [Candidatus Acidulodesulfobacterium sp. H_13]|uniref:PilN domain-containing protein n=1 Tax=Candidatus Acidulodesulfobacterium sp. H_13 TaxID=3395470 RepID=UPI003AF7A6AC